jgi:arylsulfatase A-like enzyme
MLPNIIYFNSHDTGRELSPYGSQARTPAFQKFAQEGVLFRQAFCAAPTCSPSRAALCTGEYPHVCGMVGLGNRGVYPYRFDHHLAGFLKNLGYETASNGSMTDNHMGTSYAGTDFHVLGYERHIEEHHDKSRWRTAEDTTRAAAEFIHEPRKKPFFLSLSYTLTHRIGRGFSTEPSPLDDPRYISVPATLANTAEVRSDWAHFLSDVHSLDCQFESILAAVEQAGISQSTLIIATTDHGPAFPGMKCNLNVQGTGVYLMLRGPGFSGGKVIDGMVSQVDLFPTICALLGAEAPAWLQGKAVQPLLNGTAQIHDEIFAEVSYHAAYEPMRAIRTPRHVYIRRFGDRRIPCLPNCDGSPAKDQWLKSGAAQKRLADEMLFDIDFDPQELTNLHREPEYAGVLSELRSRLAAWQERTADPVLKGRVPLPLTAWETPADEREPNDVRVQYAAGEDPRTKNWSPNTR